MQTSYSSPRQYQDGCVPDDFLSDAINALISDGNDTSAGAGAGAAAAAAEEEEEVVDIDSDDEEEGGEED